MKYKIFFFLIPLFYWTCTPDDGLERAFLLEYPNNQFEIPAGLNTIESHFFVIEDISTSKDFFFGDIPEGDIQAIVPTYARLTSLDGNNIDYDFIREISIRVCQNGESVPCTREIFYRTQIPANIGSRVDLIPNENSIKEILIEDDFTIEVVLVRLFSPPPSFIRTRLDMGFEARR